MNDNSIKKGDKVVCVSFTNWRKQFYIWKFNFLLPWSCPVNDKIYTVAETGYSRSRPDWGLLINLAEMKNDRWYTASSFRKVDEKFAEEVLEKVKDDVLELEEV